MHALPANLSVLFQLPAHNLPFSKTILWRKSGRFAAFLVPFLSDKVFARYGNVWCDLTGLSFLWIIQVPRIGCPPQPVRGILLGIFIVNKADLQIMFNDVLSIERFTCLPPNYLKRHKDSCSTMRKNEIPSRLAAHNLCVSCYETRMGRAPNHILP